MKGEEEIVRIDLTPEQRAQVKDRIGRDAEAIELTAQELEQRIAPQLTSNYNETLLVEVPRVEQP